MVGFSSVYAPISSIPFSAVQKYKEFFDRIREFSGIEQ